MASLISYVDSVTDPASPDYVAPEERIAVFDVDGTLLGERFPTYSPDDQVLMEGNMLSKNQKMNKVIGIVDEIGLPPVLVFGNSSGDLAMGQYAVQHGGRAYMLLCDDTVRDHGDPEEAASFKEKCDALGFETISMRDEFATIYGDNVVMTEFRNENTAAEELSPAA